MILPQKLILTSFNCKLKKQKRIVKMKRFSFGGSFQIVNIFPKRSMISSLF